LSRRLLLPGLPLLLAIAAPASARTLRVEPGGTGDAPTVGAALAAAASGDIVVLAPGTYLEHDVELVDGVVLRGETGDPADVIVDAGGAGRVLRGIGLGTGTRLEAVTLTGGRVAGDCPGDPGTGTYCMGGGVLLLDSSPAVSHCVFADNRAEDNGGALSVVLSAPEVVACRFEGNEARHGAAISFVSASAPGGSPALDGCVFVGNAAGADGGAIYAYRSLPAITRCTFHANSAGEQGSAILWYDPAPLVVDRCVIAFGIGEEPVFSGTGIVPTLTCCDVFGNETGDWIGCLAGQDGVDGNLAADPLFCDPDAGDVALREGSPCAPTGSPLCGTIGAAGVACAATAVPGSIRRSAWSLLKSAYRDGP